MMTLVSNNSTLELLTSFKSSELDLASLLPEF